jgi:hypothetical protein
MTSERHWSTLELDVAFAEGLSKHPELEAHLATCGDCKAYVDELRSLDVPRITPKRRWLAPAVASLALAAAVLLFLRQRTPEQPEPHGYVGVRGGTPAAMLLLKRADVTRPWDGKEPIRPKDVVAIHVACEGYRFVSVRAKDGTEWVKVSEHDCPAEAGVLPFTLVADEKPGDEELRIVFERENGESTTSHFVLPKDTKEAPR